MTVDYCLEIYPPGDRKTADCSVVSDKPFMPFETGCLIWLPVSQRTAIVEQILRVVVVSNDSAIADKVCVYTIEAPE
jgi:hypothetical protein